MENELISVIVPVYNVEQYLDKCLRSIVNQSYRNIEIIVIDDGSTDASGQICDKWGQRDRRIRVIHQRNQGLSGARNSGLEMMKGQYVTFIDSDDYVERDYVEYLYSLIKISNADISVCQLRRIPKDYFSAQRNHARHKTISGNKKCMKALFIDKTVRTGVSGKMYAEYLFKCIRFPVRKYYEDVFTSYLLMHKAQILSIGGERKYNYLIRDNSISHSNFSRKQMDIIKGNIERSRFIRKYYPECRKYAYAGIVYAANMVLLKMITSKHEDLRLLEKLQRNYRKYERYFLTGRSSVKAKIFSILAFLNIRLTYFFSVGIMDILKK